MAAHKELDMTGGTSFYDIPKIKPTGIDRHDEGPVRDVPGREITTPFDMTTMKDMIPGVGRVVDTPENNPRYWNMGGDGSYWSSLEGLGTKGKKPING